MRGAGPADVDYRNHHQDFQGRAAQRAKRRGVARVRVLVFLALCADGADGVDPASNFRAFPRDEAEAEAGSSTDGLLRSPGHPGQTTCGGCGWLLSS